MSSDAKATDFVGELFKLMPSTSGVMLALVGGLATRGTPSSDVLCTIRIAAILLLACIFLSFLGYQFMISKLQGNDADVSKSGSVQLVFFLAELAFFAGSATVIVSLFLI
ncbi:hypothetical protein [Mycobacterium sp. DL592]|uniref:hypothetical protein n=1 Tax=Mycobacterium sp. DL592 TaxID=2675524 RepID=UPI001421F9B7|nr:hypothetical protein [Mycobacterium sp. DL592]